MNILKPEHIQTAVQRALFITLLTITLVCNRASEGNEAEPMNAALENESKAENSIPVSSVVDGFNELTFRLYGAVHPPESGNLFLSPWSVSQAIAPLEPGARGETAAQIRALLRGGGTRNFGAGAAFHAANHALSDRVTAIPESDPTTLRIANGIWHEKTLVWEKSYRDAVNEHYGSAEQAADFKTNADGERKRINAWIAERTEQKIPDLLPDGTLTAATRLVLANAIYFLGEWKDAFDSSRTKELPFFVAPDDSVEVPFLVRTGIYRAADVNETFVLELPYAGEKFSMLVLLPSDPDGLANLERDWRLDRLDSLTSELLPRKIDVYFPKFEIRTKAMLEAPLASLGFTLPFAQAAADFSGITTAEPLCVHAVFHEAYVRVDEKGTEAAAATAVTIGLTSMPRPNPVFRADHPFLFLIRENETGLILFVGRVGNPAASS